MTRIQGNFSNLDESGGYRLFISRLANTPSLFRTEHLLPP
jgi:hypothetical protein